MSEHLRQLADYYRDRDNNIAETIAEVAIELIRAREMYDPMSGPHEGWAVILEEMIELFEHVMAYKQPKRTASQFETRRAWQQRQDMRHEAVQVAAMACRFMLDVCGRDPEGGPSS